MPTRKNDVQSMVAALFTVNAGLERARREKKDAGALSLLQVVAAGESLRPSEIAARQHVHQSLVTRQIREMEDAGYVKVSANPADGRSCLVTLTRAGTVEMDRLTEVGLKRFALFVKDWRSDELRALTELLEKLRRSMVAIADQERPAPGRRWAR